MVISQDEAKAFFTQLEQFSRLVRERCAGTKNLSPWGSETFGKDQPKGCVLHYTASHNLESTLRWFVDPAQKSTSSAHTLVGRRREAWLDVLAKPFPLIACLPTPVVQCRAPNSTANHGTWANNWAYGIEIMNVGEIRGERGHWVWWPKKNANSAEWTASYPGTEEPWPMADRYWEPYPLAQLTTIATIGAYANAFLNKQWAPEWIVGHEQVQGVATKKSDGTAMLKDKRDCGPGFPMKAMRRAIAGRDPALLNLPQWHVAEAYQQHYDAALRGAYNGTTSGVASHTLFNGLLNKCREEQFRPTIPAAVSMLDVLGYHVDYTTDGLGVKAGTATARSLAMFKTMSGLPAQPEGFTDATINALKKRIVDRFSAPAKEKLLA